MKRQLFLFALLVSAGVSFAQDVTSTPNYWLGRQTFRWPLNLVCVATSGEALSASGRAKIACDSATNTIKVSVNGGAFSAIGGSGTVTSVGNGTISSLFSASWTNGTTTPAFSLAPANQNANTVIAGPTSGGSGAVTARLLVAADIPNITAAQVTGTAVVTADSRLSDARTPTAHASSHAAAGSDPVTITEAQVTSLVSDLGAKQATGNYITVLTGPVTASGPGSAVTTIADDAIALGTKTTGNYAASSSEGGPATSVAADSVPLGTATTGGYAASTTEGGPATTATALAANPANCSAGNYPLGVDASGAVENCTAAPVGLSGLGSVDNILVRTDGTAGTAAQGSAISVSDASGSSVTLATTAGNALAVNATAPAATTGASQVGKAVTITASNAVASTDTAGASAGGSATIVSGDAARFSSGNAPGGYIGMFLGAGIGTGVHGWVAIGPTGSSNAVGTPGQPAIQISGQSNWAGGNNAGIYVSSNGDMGLVRSGPTSTALWAGQAGWLISGGLQYRWAAADAVAAAGTSNAADTGAARYAAGVIRDTDGSTGIRGLHGGGAAVASATAMPVPTGRVFHVTGTTTITSITSTNFQSGACVTLIFDGALTFTDGSNLKLAGDFVTTADDTISLCYDSTSWFETGRSVN